MEVVSLARSAALPLPQFVQQRAVGAVQLNVEGDLPGGVGRAAQAGGVVAILRAGMEHSIPVEISGRSIWLMLEE